MCYVYTLKKVLARFWATRAGKLTWKVQGCGDKWAGRNGSCSRVIDQWIVYNVRGGPNKMNLVRAVSIIMNAIHLFSTPWTDGLIWIG